MMLTLSRWHTSRQNRPLVLAPRQLLRISPLARYFIRTVILSWWPFGRARVVIAGQQFSIPRWVLRTLKGTHVHTYELDQTLRLVQHWMNGADFAVHELRQEELILAEMPLRSVREDADARITGWQVIQLRGRHCSEALSDHINDISAHIEFNFGKLASRPASATKQQALRDALRSVRHELTCIQQEMEVKQTELAEAIKRVRGLL
jgi:hypothetical protein